MLHWILGVSLVLVGGVTCEARKFIGPTDLSNQSYEDLSIWGPAKLHQIRASKISIVGPLDFDQLEVSQELSVVGPVSGLGGRAEVLDITGPLDLRRFLCHSLIATGPVNLNRVRVYCGSTFIGSVEAKLCRFEGVVITCDTCRFEDVETGDITFKRSPGKDPVRLELFGHCIIRGKIVFESGNGLVVIADDHSQIEESVEGAKIIRVSSPLSENESNN